MSSILAATSTTTARSEAVPPPRIVDPAAWTSAEIGGAEGLIHRLSGEQVAALLRLAESLDGRDLSTIGRSDAADPSIVALMQAVRFELTRGKGAVVLSGLDVSGISEEQFARVYWALGTHVGRGVVQSPKRDLIGRVEKREDNPEQRGYQLDIELGAHCDFHEFMSLGCYRTADSGGESGLVSGLAVHNEMAKLRPDLLAALYEGFPQQSATSQDLTAHNVPVFAAQDGVMSCFYHSLFYVNAAREMGVTLPPLLTEAMQLFNDLAKRDDLRASFLMQPGEMMFWHNFVNLHSRASFNDRPEHRRLLFRLWMHADERGGRPMVPDFLNRAGVIDRAHQQGQPGIIYKLEGLR